MGGHGELIKGYDSMGQEVPAPPFGHEVSEEIFRCLLSRGFTTFQPNSSYCG